MCKLSRGGIKKFWWITSTWISFVSVRGKLYEEYQKLVEIPHVSLPIFDGVLSKIMSSSWIAQSGLDYNYTRLYFCNVANLVKSLPKLSLPIEFDRSVDAKAKRSVSFLDSHRHTEVLHSLLNRLVTFIIYNDLLLSFDFSFFICNYSFTQITGHRNFTMSRLYEFSDLVKYSEATSAIK